MSKEFKFKYILLGVLLSFITGISNYLGFFSLIFIVCYFFAKQLVSRLYLKENYWNKRVLINYASMFSAFLVLTSVFLFPYFKAQYFVSDKSYSPGDGLNVTRSLNDFTTFTSRPWYYLLPSTDNPFYGKISKSAIGKLQKEWGYYLTQNYFKEEHSASYLGYINMLFALVGLVYIFKTIKSGRREKNFYLDILSLGVVWALLILLTMPPFITVSGHFIYTPSYLMWRIFPMFRTLARLGGFITFITLIFTGLGYLAVLERLGSSARGKISKKTAGVLAHLLVLVCWAVSLTEFYIPVKVYDAGRIPEAFKYLKENTAENDPVVIYPYSKTSPSLFWLRYYKRPLINPRSFSFNSAATNFDSEEFTKQLNTCKGLLLADSLGMKTLIIFDNVISSGDKKVFEYWESSGILRKIVTFDESPRLPISDNLKKYVKISGTDGSDSVSIYELNSLNKDKFSLLCSEPK